jgi:hypothetical protein
MSGLLQAVKDGVDSGIEYAKYPARDYRYIPEGRHGSGNCAVFAATYMVDAARAGYSGQIRTCMLKDGQGHAFYVTGDGHVLDVRQRGVGTLADVGCR